MITKGCKLIFIKNIKFDFKKSNGFDGEYIIFLELVLLVQTPDLTL